MVHITEIQVFKNNVNILTFDVNIHAKHDKLNLLRSMIKLNHRQICNLTKTETDKFDVCFIYKEKINV